MTQSDIAKHFGISQATVSLALNRPESTKYSRDLRRNILDFCREHAPEFLETKRSWNLAFAGWEDYCGNPFYLSLFSGVQTAAAKLDYTLFFEPADKLASRIKFRKIDGIVNAQNSAMPLIDFRPIPSVLLNNCAGDCSLDAVMPDNFAAIRLAFDHLLETGHRTIAYLDIRGKNGRSVSIHVTERRDAFLDCCEKSGVSPKHLRTLRLNRGEESESIRNILEVFEKGGGIPQAFICNDTYGSSLIGELERRGLRVPEDVSIVGFDNTDGNGIRPFLTSVDFNLPEIGRKALELLHERIGNPEKPHIRINIEPKLIKRKSVKERI